MANSNNITLKIDADVSDAQSAIDKFTKSTQTAFNSSNSKIQSLGNSLNKVNQNLQRSVDELNRMNTTRVPTEQYTQLENRLRETQQQASLARKELEQIGKTRVYTAQYVAATDSVNKAVAEFEKVKLKVGQLQNAGAANANNPIWVQAEADLKKYQLELENAVKQQVALEVANKKFAPNTAYDTQQQKVQNLDNTVVQLQQDLATMHQNGTATQLLSEADPERAQRLEQNITNAMNSGSLLAGKIQQMTAGLFTSENLTQSLSTGFSRVKNVVTSLASTINHRLTSAMSSYASKHNTSFKSMLTMALKYVFGIRSIFLLYKKLRTTISTGMTSLGKDFSEVQDQINSLKNSWSTFKSSLVSAFQPIYSYVLPALTTLINYLSTAMNALANFIALLTGQSYYYKATKQTKDYGDAVSGTGDSAKEASEELAEYDDLIVITSDDANSGSGGGGSSDSSGWQWEKVETTGSEFAKSLKDSISKGDWEGVGNLISEKLTSMMNKIPWNSIYQKAKDFGTNLAKFLNGLITDDLFSALGTTIANAIKTALIAAISFGGNFKWDELGEAIASGINSFVEQNPLDLLVTAFNLWANGILDTLIEAMDKVKWEDVRDHIADAIGKLDTKNIGTKVGKLVTKIVNAIYTLFANKQTWVNLGNRIADGINGFFDGFEGSELAKAANSISNALWTALITAVKNIHWGDIADDIISVMGNLDIGTISLIATVALAPAALALVKSTLTKILATQVAVMGGVSVGTIAVAATLAWTIGWSIGNKWYEMSTGNKVEGGMIDQIKDIASGIFGENKIKFSIKDFIEFTFGEDNYWNNFWADFWSKVTSYVKEIPSSVKEIGSLCVKGFMTGVTTALKGIGTWVKEQFSIIVTKVKDFFGIHSPSTVFQSIGANLIDGLKEGIKNAIKNIATWLKTNVISKITKAWDKLKTITVSLAGIALPSFTDLKEKYDAVKSKVAEITANAKEKVRNVVTNMKNTWEVIKDKTATVITTATDKVAGGISKLKETLVSIGKTFTATVETVWSTVKDKGKEVVESVQSKLDTIKAGAEAKIQTIWDTAKGKGEDVVKTITDKLDFFSSRGNYTNTKHTAKVTTEMDDTKNKPSGSTGVFSYITDKLIEFKKGGTANVTVGLKQGTWKSVGSWAESVGGTNGNIVNAKVNLQKGSYSGNPNGEGATWNSVKKFVETKSKDNMDVTSKVALAQASSWSKYGSTVKAWCLSGADVGSLTMNVALSTANQWKSVWGWAMGKNLTADQMDHAAFSYMNLYVNLKQGTNELKPSNMYSGGTITRYNGPLSSWFASGGAISPSSKSFWKSIPKYASGTNRAHGTMFIAGEAGPEVVGHIGARTEVLNKSQLASTMHTAIVNGMNEVMSRLGAIDIDLNASSLISGLTSIPMPVVVTGQILPATEAFFSNYAGDLKSRIENVEDKLDDIVNLLASTDTSNREEIVIQLDSRTITKIVWDNVEKRYKQTGRYSLA